MSHDYQQMAGPICMPRRSAEHSTRVRSVAPGWLVARRMRTSAEPLHQVEQHGKVLVHCHAGCDQRDVIAALRATWSLGDSRHVGGPVRPQASPYGFPTRLLPRLRCVPRRPLRSGKHPNQADGSPVEIYLRWRGLRISAPAALRFHRGLRHPTRARWPAMVALVTQGDTGLPLAVHRTFLDRDGSGKAPVDPQKMMLGLVVAELFALASPAPF